MSDVHRLALPVSMRKPHAKAQERSNFFPAPSYSPTFFPVSSTEPQPLKAQTRLQYAEVDLQQLQMRQRHEPPEAQAAIEAEYLEQASSKAALRPLHLEPTPSSISTLPQDLYRFNKRR